MTLGFKGKPSFQQPAHIFMPLHLVLDTGWYHWALTIINETRLSIQVYDSLPSLDLQGQIESKLQDIYEKYSWPIYEQLLYNSPIVQQSGYDCGIIVLIAVSYCADGFEIPSGAEHAPWRIILFELLCSRKT
jgi:Ulp1 family protease